MVQNGNTYFDRLVYINNNKGDDIEEDIVQNNCNVNRDKAY